MLFNFTGNNEVNADFTGNSINADFTGSSTNADFTGSYVAGIPFGTGLKPYSATGGVLSV